MKNQLLTIAVVTFFISSCTKSKDTYVTPTATEDTQPKVAGKSSKSISGSLTYNFTTGFDLTCNCGAYTAAGNFLGAGTLSHLGATTSKIKPCISPIYNDAGTHIGDHVGIECGTLVAANGDEVSCHIPAYNVIYGPTAAVGTVTVDFTGGTGRFHCASGSMTGTSTLTYSTGTVVLSDIHGTIDY